MGRHWRGEVAEPCRRGVVGGRRLLAGCALCAGDVATFMASWVSLIPFGASEAPLPRVFVLTGGVLLTLFWSQGLYPGYRMHGYELLRRRAGADAQGRRRGLLGRPGDLGSLAPNAASGAVSRDRARRTAADAQLRARVALALRYLGRARRDPRRRGRIGWHHRLFQATLAIRGPSRTIGCRRRERTRGRPDRRDTSVARRSRRPAPRATPT